MHTKTTNAVRFIARLSDGMDLHTQSNLETSTPFLLHWSSRDQTLDFVYAFLLTHHCYFFFKLNLRYIFVLAATDQRRSRCKACASNNSVYNSIAFKVANSLAPFCEQNTNTSIALIVLEYVKFSKVSKCKESKLLKGNP